MKTTNLPSRAEEDRRAPLLAAGGVPGDRRQDAVGLDREPQIAVGGNQCRGLDAAREHVITEREHQDQAISNKSCLSLSDSQIRPIEDSG